MGTEKNVTAENVRKAATVLNLDQLFEELDLPKKTQLYLENHNFTSETAIQTGRTAAYEFKTYYGAFKTSPIWQQNLVGALDQLGFIRHDINSGSFGLNALYADVYPDFRFLLTANFYAIGTNSEYEEFQNPTSEQIEAVKNILQQNLTENESAVLIYHFGLEDGEMHTMKEAGCYAGGTHNAVGIETAAIKKLRRRHLLVPIFEPPVSQEMDVQRIIKELDELYQNPIFRKEAELRESLRYYITKSPFKCANEARKYLDGGLLDSTDIEHLNFDTKIYNCLKRVDINTVADVIAFPRNRWSRIKGMGKKDYEEVENKVRALGYESFSILP